LQASSQSAGKSPVLQVGKLPLMMAANCFTQPSSRLGCLVSFHWQHLLEPLFAVNLAAILLSLFCIPAILCMRCNYVHAMCYLGEIYAVLSKTATRKHTHTPIMLQMELPRRAS
jgi:hypothetical protein